MDRASFVVEVKGPVRESSEVTVERVADALGLDDAKARALVDRMPGVITKPLPEARAAKVALRLQAAGVTAFHRHVADLEPDSVGAAAAETGAPGPTGRHRAPAPEQAGAAEGDPGHDRSSRSPLADVPSVDATLVEEPEPDPKLTPMTEAGFGAADVVVPTEPHPRFPPPPPAGSGGFAAPIVEGGATARPRADDVDLDHDGAQGAGLQRPERTGEPRRYERTGRDTPARERTAGIGAVAPSARARDAIARDRAVSDGGGRATPVPVDDDELRLTPDVVYRSTRSSADGATTASAPPDAVLKKTGVREDALSTARLRRRGSFGRRIASLVMLPAVLGWVLTVGFLWLLLPAPLRIELWVPLAAAAAVAALFGALVAALATGRLAHDVTALRDAAERVAMGELSHPIQVRRNDELGDVAASVDRMRVSLQEALDRLRRRRG